VFRVCVHVTSAAPALRLHITGAALSPRHEPAQEVLHRHRDASLRPAHRRRPEAVRRLRPSRTPPPSAPQERQAADEVLPINRMAHPDTTSHPCPRPILRRLWTANNPHRPLARPALTLRRRRGLPPRPGESARPLRVARRQGRRASISRSHPMGRRLAAPPPPGRGWKLFPGALQSVPQPPFLTDGGNEIGTRATGGSARKRMVEPDRGLW
jgi:hypothetical protein